MLTWIRSELYSEERAIHPSWFLSNLIQHCTKSFSSNSFAAKCISEALTTLQRILLLLLEWLQDVNTVLGTEVYLSDTIRKHFRKHIGVTLLLSDKETMERERKMWAMNDISALMIQAKSDPLLCRLNVQIFIEKLREKLEIAQRYEKESWIYIGSCYNERLRLGRCDGDGDFNMTTDECMHNDTVLQKLLHLQNDILSLPSLSNIKLFGSLTREMI